MKDPALISCIVPVYNGEHYLSEALDSIIAQTYRPLEIIVVDDGSTDETPHIVGRYGQQITYLRQNNQGPAAARNRGIGNAHGEFIAFLDADDLWHREKLARQMARFKARPELELCITHIKNFWVPELKHEQERLKDHRFSKCPIGYVCQTILAYSSLFEKLGGFDSSLRTAEDIEWFSRVDDRDVTSEVLTEVLVYRRIHGNNLTYNTHKKNTEILDDMLNVVNARLQHRKMMSSRLANNLSHPNDEN